ncbi:DltD N-terminal domain protein [Aureobasidium pullulans]|nr:DltD N-terminal domain protein [Aureobasidium pullulans]
MTERSDIEFKTIDHVTLRGWIFKPKDAQGKYPCLIISHGLTCLKEMYLDTLAERLTSVLPIACLVYDHRGYGSSDQKENEPRNEIVGTQQASDLQDAITYAQSREDVDASKIGLWGYSYSGGHSTWVAAIDRRVKAVIAVAPFSTGDILVNNLRTDFEDMVHGMLAQERLSRAAGNEPGKMPVIVENPVDQAALPHAESFAFFSPWVEKIGWKNELTIRSFESIIEYFPSARIHQIGPTPLLMQVPEKDVVGVTTAMLEAYSRAKEPKELQMLPGGHFSIFEGKDFETLLAKEVEFLKRTLLG